MKGLKLKVGTVEFKQKHAEICRKWAQLTQLERDSYERQASEQSAARRVKGNEPLADLERECKQKQETAHISPLVLEAAAETDSLLLGAFLVGFYRFDLV